MLERIPVADGEIPRRKNAMLEFAQPSPRVRGFESAVQALDALFDLERKNPAGDMVLVRTDGGENARSTFSNYFSDSGDFLEAVRGGCRRLLSED